MSDYYSRIEAELRFRANCYDGHVSSGEREFWLHHRANPHIFEAIVKRTLEKAKEYDECSIDLIIEELRWEHKKKVQTVSTDGTRLLISDKWTSFYARLVMFEYPELEGFFYTSKLRPHYQHVVVRDESHQEFVERGEAWQAAKDRGDA